MPFNSADVFAPAAWIADGPDDALSEGPAPCFRKAFSLAGPVQSATLTITALGLYEAEINGVRVGRYIFAPGWTDYSQRLMFQVYDITTLVRDGQNVIDVVLGDGWYRGHVGHLPRGNYGKRPKFVALLKIQLSSGEKISVPTDDSWRTAPGPILENDLLSGEVYDARRELPAFNSTVNDAGDWKSATLAPTPNLTLAESFGPPAVRAQEFPPSVVKREGNRTIYDFHQNFSGRARIHVKGPSGRRLLLRFAEMLDADGTLYTENLRSARCQDTYICRGAEQGETWEPRFTFHGFRYLEIDADGPLDDLQVVGIVLHSDLPFIGKFECSNPLLNKLQNNIVWGLRGNFLEVPTDCPQRDERMGWTGDAQVFVRTACFIADTENFFRKWMQDVRDAQYPNGAIPCVAPDTTKSLEGGPAWSDACIICPWTVYLCYGDTRIPEENYGCMTRFFQRITDQSKDNIRCHPDIDPWGGFGDWLALDGSGINEGATRKDLIGTAFFAYSAQLLARIAAVLQRPDESKFYSDRAAEIARAFQTRFLTPEGLMSCETQTACILPLRFGLLPEANRPIVARQLIGLIEKKDFHLGTGFVGTPYILDVLEENGFLDIAYRLLEQETFPSWLFPVKNGATTIWERWDGWTPERGFQDKGMNSFNHYAYGAVGAWMYRTVAGLDLDSAEPGYRHIIFRPRPGGSITNARASLQSRHGHIAIEWKLSGDKLNLRLEVPAGTRATLQPPTGFGKPAEYSSGPHEVTLLKQN